MAATQKSARARAATTARANARAKRELEERKKQKQIDDWLEEADSFLSDVEEFVRYRVGPRVPYKVSHIRLDEEYDYPEEWTIKQLVKARGGGRFRLERGMLSVMTLTPQQGQDRKWYGYYRCPKCKRTWQSAFSWVNKFQKCKGCEKPVYPYRQDEFQRREDSSSDDNEDESSKRPHDQARCEKCKYLEHPCSAGSGRPARAKLA